MEEHGKQTQTYKPKPEDWQREVNRILSTGTYVKSMVYDINGSRYTIDFNDNSITVEEL